MTYCALIEYMIKFLLPKLNIMVFSVSTYDCLCGYFIFITKLFCLFVRQNNFFPFNFIFFSMRAILSSAINSNLISGTCKTFLNLNFNTIIVHIEYWIYSHFKTLEECISLFYFMCLTFTQHTHLLRSLLRLHSWRVCTGPHILFMEYDISL
jgi:hypothetical protein